MTAVPAAIRQWWVLTARLLAPALRSGEVLTSVIAPITFTAGFYLPLERVMTFAGTGFSSYAQYMMPLVMLQAAAFTAISAAFRSATDAVSGLDRRFGTMPIPPLVPVAARMSGNLVRLLIGMASALICGYVIGFRFHLDTAHTLGFLACTLLIGIGLTLGADVIGTATRSPEATTQLLVLPPLIFGMLSTGLAPARQFPHWIQPFVRNQPISQFAIALRALAGDTRADTGAFTWSVVGPPLLWALAVLLTGIAFAVRIHTRRA
jgi:ABC-2 type transport system permease protein